MFIWLIEHIVSVIPVWMWTFVAGVGAASFFLSGIISRIPLAQARLLATTAKYAGLLVFTAGVFMTGGAGVTAAMQEAMKEMADKVAKAEAESADANARLKDAIAGKVKVIRETQIVVQEKIRQDAARIDAECKLDPIVVEDLNQAAGKKK